MEIIIYTYDGMTMLDAIGPYEVLRKRQLRGKKMAVVSCSVGEHLGAYFWLPFSKTAAYLGMEYLGNVHTVAGQDNTPHLKALIQLAER